jgi:hypothetical protein
MYVRDKASGRRHPSRQLHHAECKRDTCRRVRHLSLSIPRRGIGAQVLVDLKRRHARPVLWRRRTAGMLLISANFLKS